MSYPTPKAITDIRNYINTSISGGFSNSDIFLCGALNDPHYSGNPTSPVYIYSNFQAPSVFSLISASSVKNVLNSPGTSVSLLPLLNQLPHDTVNISFLNTWAQAYETAGIITTSEYSSITGLINQQIPDPGWSSGVSWSSIFLGRSCSLDDIDASR